MKTYIYYIGIDPGCNTGIAVWNTVNKAFNSLGTHALHEAMEIIKDLARNYPSLIFIRVEDARQRKWFDVADQREQRSGAGIREGVGSVKRDCKIWEEFLTSLKVDFEMVKPVKSGTKYNAETFRNITKYQDRTSSHSRDAGMLVYGF